MWRKGRLSRALTGAALCAAISLLLPLSQPVLAAPTEPIQVRSEIEGFASWILPTKKADRFDWYGLQVLSGEDAQSGQAINEFAAVRGVCRSTRSGGFNCNGAGRVHSFAIDAFEMDSDLGHATLDVIARGKRYRAEWIGHELAPGVYSSFEGCIDSEGDEQYGQGGGLWRHADASAWFAGKELAPATHKYATAYLARGAMVSQCEEFRPRITERDDTLVRVEWSSPTF